ncbi:Aldose 1-epimerase [Coriobacterium glomerans PW2]|uniref:Aldose 1-epimerase n=1 Tax=Coriobacterium glomerans (strain ATCC 49209 / DSM 20642 / JCM 10262 / PW2) TaxID=700015 RepID=F2NAK2_CORGP|nr:aldose 1-epimerase family protein [Coriobacterium glomerans]AEB06529.1 Aldose 1-epimerase [Coriobacterium glomerans PW2]
MEHVLTDGELSVTLSTTGGSLTSIKAAGREYLWQADPRVWSGQAPICFPICGGLREGRAETTDGSRIELSRHGFTRGREFALVDARDAMAAMRLTSTPELLSQYPFPFEFVARYTLGRVAGALDVSYEITNVGERDMPFFVGGHPAFRCPLSCEEDFTDYLIRFDEPEVETVPRAEVDTGLIDVSDRSEGPQRGRDLPLSHELFAVSETIYDRLASRGATLLSRRGTHGVRLTFPDMPYLIVWSKPAGDFVAIEPWGGLSTCSDEDDIFEHKRGCLIARPGETVTRGFTIEVF